VKPAATGSKDIRFVEGILKALEKDIAKAAEAAARAVLTDARPARG
jgi:hypothetical protein